MLLLFTLFLGIASAAEDPEFNRLRRLEEKLPRYSTSATSEEPLLRARKERRFKPTQMPIRLEKIKESPIELGSVRGGVTLIRIVDDKKQTLTQNSFFKFHKQEDEFGFKYLVNKDGEVTHKIDGHYLEPIKEELAMYEPPTTYTPAPMGMIKTEYDRKLHLRPEFGFYTGYVRSDFIQDLFNDSKASTGATNQYGIHVFTDWKLPIKAGAVFHYERAAYNLAGGGQAFYQSFSFGPQFKTRDFHFLGFPTRFQIQFRVSPFARIQAETVQGTADFKFNSADLLASLEVPIKNFLGEFVLGFFFQNQWLNLKDQEQIVSVRASNETNKAFGLSLAQVFE
jgi:hypothetical protein